ncbi:hypothetical protein MERGE_002065 [Pneumocystis wakefieldiae]|uniref:Cysteine-rich PDZ-binding protein n=1 Tax=Pneumocystis wakefieldiae TaxID=38082 RepID=A0A899FVV6_9ASCO|nr:hypothetical protein MERGE_002065 [Pneumocystis wakefieldiae]
MVCSECEKKGISLATPSVKKKSEIYMGSEMAKIAATSERKIGENKLLSNSAKKRYDPYGVGCKTCKQRTHHLGAKYCPGCAYKQGRCSICGKKIMDTSAYKQSSR